MWRPLCVFLLLLCAPGLEASTSWGAPHRFTDQQCRSCHLSDPSAGDLIFVDDLDRLCLDCHGPQRENGHPSLIEPGMPMPAEFWTDRQGRLTCATCHAPHPAEGETSAFLLRGSERGTAFCEQCHDGQDPHRTAVFLAHSRSYTPSDGGAEALDPVSGACLECHDPKSPHSGVCIIGQEGNCGGHIVGIDYDRAATLNRELRPRGTLSALISLYDGKVGCTSCHSIYSREDALLVMSNAGSALCRACHQK